MKKQSVKKFRKIAMFFGIGFVFLFLFLISFYFCNPLSRFNKNFFKIIPYPIALVDGDFMTTRSLLRNTESLEKFYKTQDFSDLGLRVDFKTSEGQQRLKIKEKEVFNKLVENKLIEKIAKSKGIIVTEKEASEELITKAQEAGNTENLALNLKKLYNWSLVDFRDKVIIPRLYLGRLIDYHEKEAFQNNLENTEIAKAYKELENGIDFDEAARKYSTGETASNGGALGWFEKDYLAGPIAQKAFSMKPGEFSEIIRTPLGSHIIYLEEINEEGDEKEVKLKQIFTQEGSFLDWLNEEKNNFSVRIFLRDYYWNKDELKIHFSNEEMEEKEVAIRNKSKGDPSI